MEHHFNCEIAELCGVNAAIILNNLSFWIRKNKNDNRHFYEGTTWTYISREGLKKNFPYLSKKQIDYALEKLIDKGIIITGDFNRHSFDKTKWYALTTVGEELLQKRNIEYYKRETSNTTKGRHRILQNGDMYNIYNNTIYSDTDKNPEINHTDIPEKPDLNTDLKSVRAVLSTINTDLRIEVLEYIEMRKKMKKPLTAYALKLALNKLERLSRSIPEQVKIVRQSIEHSWQSFYPLHSSDDEMGEAVKDTADIEAAMQRQYGGG